MFAPLLLVACLAPPAEGSGGPGGDPWAARVGPRVTFVFGTEQAHVQPPQGPLTVGVRVDPFVPGGVTLFFDRDARDPVAAADPDAGPRDHLERVIGAEVRPELLLPGTERPYAGPPAGAGGAGLAVFTLFPPEGGWPRGAGELVATVPDAGVPDPRATRPIYVGERSPATAALDRLGLLTPPAPPAPDPPPVTVLTLEEFDPDGPGPDPDADPLPVPAGHALEVRGTYRAAPPEVGAAYGPEIAVLRVGPVPTFGERTRAYRDPGGADEVPGADGRVLYWFRATLPPAPAAGRWLVSADASPGFGGADGPHFAPRTVRVAPADGDDEDGGE